LAERFLRWALALLNQFGRPNSKQREAYARYCHTLSAVAMVGLVTLIFSELSLTAPVVLRAVSMLVAGVVLLVIGTSLLREA
jgi:hypothetical protein